MGMFIVKKDCPCYVIRSKDEWMGPNIKNFVTTKDNVFDKGQMILDPSGISKHACIPGSVTVGSHYASLGYYGFEEAGYYLIIHNQFVQYG